MPSECLDATRPRTPGRATVVAGDCAGTAGGGCVDADLIGSAEVEGSVCVSVGAGRSPFGTWAVMETGDGFEAISVARDSILKDRDVA